MECVVALKNGDGGDDNLHVCTFLKILDILTFHSLSSYQLYAGQYKFNLSVLYF